MSDDHRQRIFMLRTNVNEVNVEPIDLSEELRQSAQFRLDLAPIVVVGPITREFLHRRELHALRSIGDDFPLRPFGCRYASTQFVKFLFRDFDMKRTNSVLVSCLLTAWLCGSGLGHCVLLLNEFDSRIGKSLDDRPGAERDGKTQHRTLLQKTTPRSVV